MPWDDIARADHAWRSSRYASDATDREWELLAPLRPDERELGQPCTLDFRQVMNAIHYIATTGCLWRYLPTYFPPVSTVQRYFYHWRDEGLSTAVNGVLMMAAQELEGREASPTVGVIHWSSGDCLQSLRGDSQSVKTTETGGFPATTPAKGSKGEEGRFAIGSRETPNSAISWSARSV